ncbi:hypothetical protein [Streptomyces sp. H27-S2]|uniref:hypothetical protein n=1 Tax=Streptomyces antarcticus TaxID=2996458 RepID=UPI00226E4957|nr:hypothetical protein [Streptomyces sp. H27-S2]MCY0949859.1 hypothetical protein [Streptomyces sp. H27-S2]
MALAAVRDLREFRDPVSAEELDQFETDVLAGFVLARASAGLADGTIRGDVGHLDQMRAWFGRPLWAMELADADVSFGKVLRHSPSGTRLGPSQALNTYFLFLELRHKVELHRMTARVVECPIDEMNRPRGAMDAQLPIPPSEPEVGTLFTGPRAADPVEDAWVAGMERAAKRLEGLARYEVEPAAERREQGHLEGVRAPVSP